VCDLVVKLQENVIALSVEIQDVRLVRSGRLIGRNAADVYCLFARLSEQRTRRFFL
jgi:hypothetical protein